MWNERRIEPAGDGGYLLRLPEEERQLLRFLPDELRSLLEVMPGDPALRRLFPRAYEDEQDEAAYRELMGNELAEGRNRALQVLSETATAERLTAEQAQAWLTALNDLRLVLGTRLDVTDESLLEGLAENDPRAPELALYAYLSWLQEQLVEALSAELASRARRAEGGARVVRFGVIRHPSLRDRDFCGDTRGRRARRCVRISRRVGRNVFCRSHERIRSEL